MIPWPGEIGFAQWMGFLLVLTRTAALLAAMPFFGSPNLPPMLKAGLSLSVSVALFPALKIPLASYPTNLLDFVVLGVGEVMVGMILGYSVRLILTAVQIMGQLIGFQMGFGVANVIDPMGGGQVSVLGQFIYMMTILVFFSVQAHHWFFMSIVESFRLVPPGSFHMTTQLYQLFMRLAGDMFLLALKVGAPVVAALLLTSAVMGVLAKTVPQMNILVVGFPIKIAVGLFVLAGTMGVILGIMSDNFRNLGRVLTALMKAM